jgi:hypothetical protein
MPWAMAEDEEACLRIGWQPYHVQQGYDLNQSTLTAASALMWGNNLTPASHTPEKIMQVMAWDVVEKGQFATGSGPKLTPRTILITEYVARDLAQEYKSNRIWKKRLSRRRAGRLMNAPTPTTGPTQVVPSTPPGTPSRCI